jgi:MraZ protein
VEVLPLARDVPRFTGQAECALDDKGRLVVPVRFRERLGSGFFLTIARPDPCLALYPDATWRAFCDRLEEAAVKDQRFRRYVRKLSAYTEETQCDAQGRVTLPPKLRAFAGIEREVVAIGTLGRIELWAKDRLGELDPADDEDAGLATELGLY